MTVLASWWFLKDEFLPLVSGIILNCFNSCLMSFFLCSLVAIFGSCYAYIWSVLCPLVQLSGNIVSNLMYALETRYHSPIVYVCVRICLCIVCGITVYQYNVCVCVLV